MKRYTPIIKKATFNYPSQAPAVMDENAQQEAPKDGGYDVTGYHKVLCRHMEAFSLKDLPQLISSINGATSDNETLSN